MGILYEVDPMEMTCTCPAGKFRGRKKVCRHVRQVVDRDTSRMDKNGAPRFSVWKEKGGRWFVASSYRGFVSDDLGSIMRLLKKRNTYNNEVTHG